MGRKEEPAWARGTVGMTAARERGDIDKQFQSRLMVTRSGIDRLGLEKELHGHNGCVNCLEWNRDGSILASASDDTRVILWDPYRYKQLHNIETGHNGNIFSVKFLGPDVIATGAADGVVRTRNIIGDAALRECSCHCGRVKRLAAPPLCDNLLWSAGEDGLILQHDLRAPHRCNAAEPVVLLSLLNHLGKYAEAKCVAANPRRAHQLAVGGNDFHCRLYDTRMIKLAKLQSPGPGFSGSRSMWERQNMQSSRAGHGDPEDNIPRSAVSYFAPGHLSLDPSEQVFPKKAITYVAFSDDGNELLVNLGSEQIYLYDINSARLPVLVESFIIRMNHKVEENKEEKEDASKEVLEVKKSANGTVNTPATSATSSPELSGRAMRLKDRANEMMNKGNYAGAVELYNEAIALCDNCAVLYSNRAAALPRRGWAGDTYAAIKDCYAAIRLDPEHVKAHFRLAKGLMELKRAREAHECLLYFKHKFPKHAASHAVFLLLKDIRGALQGAEAAPDEAEPGDAPQPTSALEKQLRAAARDYKLRFLGHCNTTTDIKEATFLGPDAAFVAAGSDDGSLFVWSRAGNVVRCLRADESIVNCVQLHPSALLLASSGIEACVRLWSPRPEDGGAEARLVAETQGAAQANQRRMRSDPFEAMLLNINFAAGERDVDPHSCRPS